MVSWAAQAARDKAGHSDKSFCHHTHTVLVSFSSAAVATLHFGKLFQTEEKWQFKAIKIHGRFKGDFYIVLSD